MLRAYFIFFIFCLVIFFIPAFDVSAKVILQASPFESLSLFVLISIVVGIYEVIVRAIPSVGNYSALHFFIEILRRISDLFNRKK